MATEKGTVVRVDSSSAWVKTTRTKACDTCQARSSCHTLGGGGEDIEVEAINEAGAKVDDTVVLSFKTSSFLKATFLVYMLPILSLMAGIAMGHAAASLFHLDPSAPSVIIGFLFFVIAIWFVKIKGNKLSQTNEYRPKIIRIVRQHIKPH